MSEPKAKSALEELAEIERAGEEEIAAIKLAVAKSQGPYKLELAWPIQVGSETRTSLEIRPQTIKDIRESKSDDVFTSSLCGLSPDQVQQLSPDDWNAVQAVIEGFTLRRAAFGRARKG